MLEVGLHITCKYQFQTHVHVKHLSHFLHLIHVMDFCYNSNRRPKKIPFITWVRIAWVIYRNRTYKENVYTCVCMYVCPLKDPE